MLPTHLPTTTHRRRILAAVTVLALSLSAFAGTAATPAPAHASQASSHPAQAHASHPAKAKVKAKSKKAKHHTKAKHHKKAKHKKAVHKPQPAPLKSAAPTTSAVPVSVPTAPTAVPTAGVAATVPQAVPESPLGGPFGPGSFWRQSLIGAPVAPGSAAMVSTLAGQVAAVYGGVAAFNVWQFNTSFYTVGSGQPRVDVIWDNCQGKPGVPTGLLGPGGQFTSVPIPANAVAATGSDAELTVYSPSSDQIWDFWHARHATDGWHACWGGRIDQVSLSLGYFTGNFGVAATAIAEGEPVSINDVRSGVINHAIPIAIPSPAISTSFSWPAQRSDGIDPSASAMPEGTRLRLPSTLDLSTLGLTPIGLMIAKAAQKYGMVVIDRAGAVSVIAESGNGDVAQTGHNPWDSLLGGVPGYATLRNFPWSKLEAMPHDFGKPANAPV